MNIVIPLLSIIGPIYFATRGFPVELVLAWAVVWTGLRFVATWKSALAVLTEGDGDEPPSWLNRYPSAALVGALVATLAMFEATHVVVYYTIRRLIQISS